MARLPSNARFPKQPLVNGARNFPLLLSIWRDEGWAGYGNGRFWLVNPDEYEHIKDAWLEETPLANLDTFHVIARSAFGDLYLCGEKQVQAPQLLAFIMRYWLKRTD